MGNKNNAFVYTDIGPMPIVVIVFVPKKKNCIQENVFHNTTFPVSN